MIGGRYKKIDWIAPGDNGSKKVKFEMNLNFKLSNWIKNRLW